jgi:YfiH family protein
MFIVPNWPAPANVKAVCTTSKGGYSMPPFAQLNLATHVEDNPHDVARNRAWLSEQLHLPNAPMWLNQVHGTTIVPHHGLLPDAAPTADAAYTTDVDAVCAVLTADCLPVLICNQLGTQVAAVHAGWRGLSQGILSKSIATFTSPTSEILVFLGPAIHPSAFAVGETVLRHFVDRHPAMKQAFHQQHNQYYADLYQLARLELTELGVQKIFQSNYCTYRDQNLFFSYRREQQTGRQASLIWLS